MIRAVTWRLSLASQRTTPFTQAALHMLTVHQKHQSLLRDADGSREPVEAELRALEAEAEDAVDRLRVCYNTMDAFAASRFYSQKVRLAMRYFGLGDDPLCRSIELQLGRLTRADGKPERVRSTAVRTYVPAQQSTSAGSAAVAEPADTRQARIRLDPLEARHFEFKPEEFPAPPQDFLRRANHQDGHTKFDDTRRGHWILRDPGIATTKAQRRTDPW